MSECGPCLFEAVREGWDNIGEGIVKTENGGLNGGEEVAEEELEGLREERERREEEYSKTKRRALERQADERRWMSQFRLKTRNW